MSIKKECFYDIIFLVYNVGTTKHTECNFLKKHSSLKNNHIIKISLLHT